MKDGIWALFDRHLGEDSLVLSRLHISGNLEGDFNRFFACFDSNWLSSDIVRESVKGEFGVSLKGLEVF